MIEIGTMQEWVVREVREREVLLGDEALCARLPRQEAPATVCCGERLAVFVWREGDQLQATTARPQAELGEFAYLRVSQVASPGAFLSWGIRKDLLVPHAEQPETMQVGRRYLVKVCLDDRGRLVGTARIDRCLEKESIDLKVGQAVDLVLWRFTDLGAMVIVDGLYSGLLYQSELQGGFRRGDRLQGFVSALREDGKIDISLRQPGRRGIEDAKQTILEALEGSGFLPLHDDSSPQQIRRVLGMSKKAFKQAVGGLYKAGVIRLSEKGLHLTDRQRLDDA